MGVVQALGGNEFVSDIATTNLSGDTLAGGTWKAVGNGSTIDLVLANSVTTLAAICWQWEHLDCHRRIAFSSKTYQCRSCRRC